MKHYVVFSEWAYDGVCERGVDIKAVVHTPEEAKEAFGQVVEDEKNFAEGNGWEVFTDTDTEFDAGHFGYYDVEHVHLCIQEVN